VSVDIQAYDPGWPAGAEAAVGELMAALPGLFSAIEHIGSTSVPGLAAKPIIDLMAATADLESVSARDADLAALGYQRVGTGMPKRLLYARHVAQQSGALGSSEVASELLLDLPDG
jgi:GrpB-like predicted nucleotidyltransferase (UPF0157 family)